MKITKEYTRATLETITMNILLRALFISISIISCDELPEITIGPKTQIVLAGENITLTCGTTINNESLILVSWQKNGQTLGLSRHRQTLVHHPHNGSLSTLFIDNVSEIDEGVYQCSARNDFGLDVSRPAKLSVQYGAKITSGQRFVYNVTVGSKVPIECNARGQPPPRIELFINNQSLLEPDKELHSNVFIQFVANETTNITCKASNFLKPLNRSQEDAKIFEIFVQQAEEPSSEVETIEMDEERGKKNQPNGYCAPYVGHVCRKHIPRNSLVFFNLSDTDDFANNINEDIVSNLWQELIVSLQEPCRLAAEKLLCYYAFPECHWSKGFPQAKPLCHEDCIAVRESFCAREWALLEDNKQRGVFFKSRAHFRLPECETLPKQYNRSNWAESEQCSHAELTNFRKDEVTIDCINGRGRFYQGDMNVTKNGLACQRWDHQSPHAHNRPPFVFPEIWNSVNYCRNPGGEERLPWCFTTNPAVRWEHCRIAYCGGDASNETSHSMANNQIDLYETWSQMIRQPLGDWLQHKQPLAVPIALSVIVVFLVTSSAIFIFVIRYFCLRKSIYTDTMMASNIDLSKLPSNCAYHCTQASLSPKLEALEYPRNRIIYIRDISCGEFGRVFLAKAPEIIKSEHSTLIAVKVLKDEASENMLSDLEHEASLMAELDHANVLKLLGVCALGRPMCLLFEYMARGDLKSFLRSLGPANYVIRLPHEDAFIDHPRKLTDADLVNFALQIARGMVYLSDKLIVHRDLATRNCLVNDQLITKISDFGLSQRVQSTLDYYRADIEKDALPIRWMPPEAISYGHFSIASDVWAFGVLMWEIFVSKVSRSLQPYCGLSHEQVIAYLKDGHLLQMPESCPPSIYSLMRTCWHPEPHSRPSFGALEKSLQEVYNSLVLSQMNDDDARSRLDMSCPSTSICSIVDD